MTEVATKQRLVLTSPPPAGANAPVLVDESDSPKAVLSRELDQTRAIAKLAREHHDRLTYGLPKFKQSRAQAIAGELTPYNLVGTGILGTFVAVGWGSIAATIAQNDFQATGAQQLACFGWVVGAFAALECAVVAVGVTARNIAKRQRARRITPQDLEPLVRIFEDNIGRRRAAAGVFMTRWLSTWHAGEALTPQAREVLEQIKKRTESLPTEDQERAATMRDLTDYLDCEGRIPILEVVRLKDVLLRLPSSERKELVPLICKLIRASGRPLDYSADHALHDLANQYV